MRMGREPDLEQAARRYPELADDLRSLWATVWVAEEMARADWGEEEPEGSRGSDAETVDWPPAEGHSPDGLSPPVARIRPRPAVR